MKILSNRFKLMINKYNILSESDIKYKHLKFYYSFIMKLTCMPECMTKYFNYKQEIEKQIDALNKINQRYFCKNCQAVRLNIINKNDELKDCYHPNILRYRLIDDVEIKDFMDKCLPLPNCSYNGTSHVKNPPGLNREPENTCGRRKDCKKGASPPQVLTGKAPQVLNPQSSRTNVPARQEDLNIKQLHAERGGSTEANTLLDNQKNVFITNGPAAVQSEASYPKDMHPFSTPREAYIPEQPPSASQYLLHSELDNSSNDSSPRVNPGSESRAKAIAQEKGSEAVKLENDRHGLLYVSGSTLGAQELRSTTSTGHESDVRPLDSKIPDAGNLEEKPPGGADGTSITPGDRNFGNIVNNFVDGILGLGGNPLYSTLTNDRDSEGNYISQPFVETPVDVPVSDDPTGDNSETPFKKYTTMALAPTGIIMLMTLLTKFTPLGMLFTKKNRNKRNDMKENIERILLLESPAKTEESGFSFAYTPSQYWET
ncbi:variable surface protein Vir18-related [Plasmodium vivax]|uniref:Variable surface protein Vir18-related n=1 Tax=Plasmodium vivax (strain Salvador I) TaxID=126793 RepID=A5KCX4_PLAVS|nr:variable surface protein Vir18-related [Plasmodium vivax]EDL42795.1 variable surface protein Vir18-related [Plasmodium vivax]|eukprot:XP_001612586.1 variable surface protein Vir18-related [Plasmodium vivax Sal-1]